ncbi:MAG TPA: AMP-binding protein [Candidatus Aminicenantes bacterium]|nr:AMP-binding protein [Candidatus Aminicenantes bacterium]
MPERTLPELFETSVGAFPGNVLIWEKTGGRYVPTTYSEMGPLVERFAAGLLSLGLAKADRAALIAEGRRDWIVAELGMLSIGAINVPLSIKLEELSELKFRLAHSGCRLAVVSRSQLPKLRRIKPDLADLATVVVLDDVGTLEADEIAAAEVLRRGEELLRVRPDAVAAARAALKGSDPANICYTSGTTADPKGIVLTHRNYTANIEQSRALVDCPEHYVCLLILPWDHSFCHTCGIYSVMKSGAAMAAVEAGRTGLETLRNIPLNIKEVRPHILLSVPALAKSFRKSIEKGIKEKGPKVEALFKRALALAVDYNGDGWNRGRGLRKLKKPLCALYDKLLFSKVRRSFGGRLELFVGGGALLDVDMQRFFYALGIPMLQGYGLTEAAPVISANSLKAHKLGSSGRLAPGIELRICDDAGRDLPAGRSGEIVVRGENVMAGYWKNDKATGEALRDGWLHTGDLGYLDEDGFLYVLGRMKSLLIGSDGEKFSPEAIEEALTETSPFIEQVMLYNCQSLYTVALVVPDKGALLGALRAKGLSPRTPEGQEEALRLLEGGIASFREGGRHAGVFPARWLPAALAVLGEPFTEQNRFLNSTMKMVRDRIADHYRGRLDHLFTPEGKDILNPQNRTIVSRFEGPD